MAKKQKPETQASYIRTCLARKRAPETILEECEKRFPKGNVTLGYINWIAKQAAAKSKSKPKAKAKAAKQAKPARRIDGSVDEHLS